MSRPHHGATISAAKNDLLGRLGLPAGADDHAIDEAHARIVAFLDGAPDDLRGWADRRQREADRVFALLNGPDADLAPVVERVTGPQAPAARRGLPAPALWAIGLLAGFGLVFAVYWIGRPASDLAGTTAARTSVAPTPAAVDPARVAELTAKVQANPQDTASWQSLANLYMDARDYPNATATMGRILAYDPTNETALIGSGVAAFNSGDVVAAEALLTEAATLYPDNPEAHYDLGFLYMATERSDLMKAEWDKVVQLAPDSEMAKAVQSHVGDVVTGAPSPAPGK